MEKTQHHNKKLKRNVTIVLILLLFGLAALVGMKQMFCRFVFTQGIESSQDFYDKSLVKKVNYGCDQLKNVRTKDLIINFKYDYPLVDFDGAVIVRDSTVRINHVPRVVFAGLYENPIVIKDLCYDASNIEGNLNLVFYFIDPKHQYPFGMRKKAALLKNNEIEAILRWDDKLSGNVAIVSPMN